MTQKIRTTIAVAELWMGVVYQLPHFFSILMELQWAGDASPNSWTNKAPQDHLPVRLLPILDLRLKLLRIILLKGVVHASGTVAGVEGGHGKMAA